MSHPARDREGTTHLLTAFAGCSRYLGISASRVLFCGTYQYFPDNVSRYSAEIGSIHHSITIQNGIHRQSQNEDLCQSERALTTDLIHVNGSFVLFSSTETSQVLSLSGSLWTTQETDFQSTGTFCSRSSASHDE